MTAPKPSCQGETDWRIGPAEKRFRGLDMLTSLLGQYVVSISILRTGEVYHLGVTLREGQQVKTLTESDSSLSRAATFLARKVIGRMANQVSKTHRQDALRWPLSTTFTKEVL